MTNQEREKCKFLFKGFFDDRKTYNLCEAHWKRYIKRVVEDYADGFCFLKNSYGNGLKIYDANPIVCFLFRNKAIRIILSPDSEYEVENKDMPDYDLTAYIDSFSYLEKEYKELVLSLFMCPTAVDKAKRILMAWLTSENDEIDLTGESVPPIVDDDPGITFRSVATKAPGLSSDRGIWCANNLKDEECKSIKRPRRKK